MANGLGFCYEVLQKLKTGLFQPTEETIINRSTTILLTSFLLSLFLVGVASAKPVTEVVSTSPSWDSFTNEDGTGLYHEILRAIFNPMGIKVRHIYAPSVRSEKLMRAGQADMMTCDDRPDKGFVLGRYPMYENSFHVFFSKERIGPWKGVETLRGKEIISKRGYYFADNFEVPVKIKNVNTAAQAVDMIALGRSDFYVDDMALMNEAIKTAKIPFNRDDFGIEEAGRRAYYPQFTRTLRGQRIKKMYEDGMMRLHKSGKLKEIFKRWSHPYPHFDEY